MTPDKLARQSTRAIADLIECARRIAPTEKAVDSLSSSLWGLPPQDQKLLAAALEELRAELERVQMAEQYGGLGDK